MFSGFTRSLAQVSIFHHPSSPPSVKALSLLHQSLTSSYPPNKPGAPPLKFDLEVVESKPPTGDQLPTILSYLLPSQKSSSPSLSTFLSSHPTSPDASDQPQSAEQVTRVVSQNPNAFKWPVVVDWSGGRASIGSVDGVKEILEAIRQERDGEGKKEDAPPKKGWFT